MMTYMMTGILDVLIRFPWSNDAVHDRPSRAEDFGHTNCDLVIRGELRERAGGEPAFE
jgi:hypothetical protein